MWPWSENRLLKSALRLYAGEHVLANVLAEGKQALALKGQRTELTVMFIDIVGFTKVDELFSPEELSRFINAYLQTVTDAVVNQGGVLDSYTGDAVMAWWHDAKAACVCAKQIVEGIELLNAQNSSENFPNIKIGIGVHTGPVSLGNYGSRQRIKYTVLGDSVNLASRLCHLANTHYPVPVVISGATQVLIANSFSTEALAIVKVKGKDDSIQLFSL